MFDDLFDIRIDFLGQVWTTNYSSLPDTILNTTRLLPSDMIYIILRDQLHVEALNEDQELHWPPEEL